MKKINIFNLIVYIVIILSYLGTVLYKKSSLINAILGISIIGIILFWLIKNKKKIKYSILFIIYISILLIILTQKFNLISIALIGGIMILAGFKSSDITIKSYLTISLLCFSFVLILYFGVGLNKECDTSIWRVASNAIEYRYALGFNHANQAMFKWLSIAMGFLCLSTKRNVFKVSFIIGLVTAIMYYLTVSRTSVVVIFFIIINLIFFKNTLSKKVSAMFRIILGLTPIICTFISFLSIYLYKLDYINNLFSGRFVLYKYYLDISGLNLFGNNFIENNAMLDNSYLHMLLSKGLIFSLAYMILIYAMISRTKNITRGRAIILLAYFMAGLAETILFKFELIILIIIIIYKNPEEGEKKCK